MMLIFMLLMFIIPVSAGCVIKSSGGQSDPTPLSPGVEEPSWGTCMPEEQQALQDLMAELRQ